ncbi:hypothetical protein EAO79_12095 [Plantibacter sp. PA-3-X8]|nr:hypothetical protein EAO79_12095 [Plantibacter sp. PA-3-X8]
MFANKRITTEAQLQLTVAELLTRVGAPLGEELLLIGCEIPFRDLSRIDMLAINREGTIYLIELKWGKTSPSNEVVGQILRYWGQCVTLSRADLIRMAADRARIDLEASFRRRFGRDLPADMNARQMLMVIAPSFGPKLTDSLLALESETRSVKLVVHVVDDMQVTFFPWTSSGRGPAHHAASKTRAPRPVPVHSLPYNRSHEFEEFWADAQPKFASESFTVLGLYADYLAWRQRASTSHETRRHPLQSSPIQNGLFGRQLASQVYEHGGWEHGYMRVGAIVRPLAPLRSAPSFSYRVTDGHRISAYRRLVD